MNPSKLIANAIIRERARAGLSLSALAAQAGLAKSTLSQIEAGKGNPGIETLWAIASALNIPFSFLFETETPKSHIIRANEGTELSSEESDFSTVLLAKCPPLSRRDLFRANLQRGAIRKADSHPQGTVEHVFVSSGSVRVGPNGMEEELTTGDYFRYPADAQHSYEALTRTATVLIIMESPR